MFVNDNVLKRLIKNAWKGAGLHIEHTTEGWFAMSGFYWFIEVDNQMLSNKIKAQIVECIGELPAPGEGYLYIKGHDDQMEIPGTTYRNMMAQYDKLSDKTYEFTNVLIKAKNGNLQILEGLGLNKIMVPEWAADLIDEDAVKDGETKPGPAASDNKTPYIIWRNNVMAIAVFKRDVRYEGEREFLEAVEDVSLCWDFVEEED